MLPLLFSRISCTDVFVMSSLDALDSDQNWKNKDHYLWWMDKLHEANVDGIMIDVWWGITEKSEKVYDFHGYREVFTELINRNLKILPVFSFHLCGGNVGDTCNFPIPSFVINSPKKPFFVDANDHVDTEYISFAYDNVQITNRTAIQMYKDWMAAFKKEFNDLLDNGNIVELEIGMGPAGEARYPSYQLAYWDYPGCGEFQSYDPEFIKYLQKEAEQSGHSDWGHNPIDEWDYNTFPGGSDFWKYDSPNNWKSDYGRWFMKTYSKRLAEHVHDVLAAAREVFPNTRISGKISGIHWWYTAASHCAENTAGFNNLIDNDGYKDLIAVFKQFDAHVCFTCLEMLPSGNSGSNPPKLVQQVLDATVYHGLDFEGENALPFGDTDSYNRIINWVPKGLKTFTYLRVVDWLFDDGNYNNFKSFVQNIHNAK